MKVQEENHHVQVKDEGPLLSYANFKISFFDKIITRTEKLEIFPGERLVLMGPSGTGKTLFLRALSLLEPWIHGELLWKNRPVEPSKIPAFRGQVTYLQQNTTFFDGTVEMNLRWPYQLQVHRHKNFDEKKVISYLEVFGLEESFLKKSTVHLSGGEKQMVALIRLLQLNPQILLLDEPTAALDKQSALNYETLVLHWLKENPLHSFLWVTHSLEQAARVANRIINF